LTVICTTKVDGKVYATNPADIKNPFQIKGLNPDQTVVRTEISTVAPTMVWNYVLSDIRMLYIITYQESRYNQFAPNANIVNRKDPFYPLQGVDNNDFGIMQINNPTSDDLIWNWKKNVAAGMGVHSDKKRAVARYIDDIKNATCGYYAKYKTKTGRDTLIWTASNQPGVQADWYGTPDQPFGCNPTAMSEQQRITETFQRYNGGVYYRWEPDDSKRAPSGSGKWKEAPTKMDTNTKIYGKYAKDCMNWYNGTCPWE
jgi:Transglycosylase SLT domain.